MDSLKTLKFKHYLRKPVEVKIAKLTEDVWNEIFKKTNYVAHIFGRQVCATQQNKVKYFLVDTLLEGLVRGEIDDYLVSGAKGGIYVCKPENFKQMYKAMEQI